MAWNYHTQQHYLARAELASILGFTCAWLSPEQPDSVRLVAPAVFAATSWLMLVGVAPWVTALFNGRQHAVETGPDADVTGFSQESAQDFRTV